VGQALWRFDAEDLSAGTATGSNAEVRSGASVTFCTNMDLSSSNEAKIGQDTTVDVGSNLNMDAAELSKRTVPASAIISAGSTSGVCAPLLP